MNRKPNQGNDLQPGRPMGTVRRAAAAADGTLSDVRVIGTPELASYTRRRKKGADGSETEFDTFRPEEETALEWVRAGREILVDDLWVETDGDGTDPSDEARVCTSRNGRIEAVLRITVGNVREITGFDLDDQPAIRHIAVISGVPGANPADYGIRCGDWLRFRTASAMYEFLSAIQDIRAKHEEFREL